MGYRVLSVGFDEDPSSAVLEWVKQFCAYAESYGAGPSWELREEDGGLTLEIQLDANSSYLNSCTPLLCEAAAVIARDIDAEDSGLSDIASELARQLAEQVVPHDPNRIAIPTRPGREASERVGGEASLAVLMQELAFHHARLRSDCQSIASASGPSAWRTRLENEFAARVDALAVVNTARRIERVAIDLRDRLGDSHLRTALRTFANTSRQVADLRNIAEHIEEYAVGRGHLDKGEDIEPGQVIRLSVEPDDIVLAARGHSDSIGSVVEACERLASCVDAALSAHLFDLYFPEGLDFDFMVSEPDGTNRVVSELSEEQMTFKRLLADHREKEVPAQIDRGLCTTCGLKL